MNAVWSGASELLVALQLEKKTSHKQFFSANVSLWENFHF